MSGNSRGPSWLVFVMAGLASLALSVVVVDGGSRWEIAISALVPVLVAIISGRLIFSRYRDHATPPSWLPALIVFVGLATFAEEFVRRQFFGNGRAFEILLLCGFRNVMLTAAAATLWKQLERIAGMLSLFLMLFTAISGDDKFLHVVLLAYTLVGVWWLLSFHWGELVGELPDEETRLKRPLLLWVSLPLLLIGLLVVIPVSGESGTGAAQGFLPSSGGEGGYDEYARRGVGDGDMLVAGTKNVQSFAPIDEAPFMDSDKPSLYDVFNETYEDPAPPKNQDRAISLPPKLMKEASQRMAESQGANRQFSTLRKAPKPRKDGLSDRESHALFFVAGRTPLHLRMETYDIFDGIEWYPEDQPKVAPPIVIREIVGKPWVDLGRSAPVKGTHPEPHALKIGKLETNRIPSPSGLMGLHIDKLSQPDLFQWATGDILRMNRKALPAMLVVHLQSRVWDRKQLGDQQFPFGELRYRAVPKTFAFRKIQELAEDWTRGLPRGWEQIAAIERGLRENYQLDAKSRPNEDCICPVGEFLFRTKRGPDYQFATAAVVMLRSLGYTSRVVSGFYAHHEKYDRRSRHTLVDTEDVHFWAEVKLASHDWVPVEPTPGYEVLAPPPTWVDRINAGLIASYLFLVANRVAFGLCGLLLIVVFVFRRRLADGFDSVFCSIAIDWFSPREQILQTLRLLDRRRERVGLSRTPGMTPTKWLQKNCVLQQSGQLIDWGLFLRLADQAAFDHRGLENTPHPDEQLNSLCRLVRRSLDWRAMKQLALQSNENPPTTSL